MTPGARLAAAIEVMDDVLAGTRAEKALSAWGRRSRFAGSKDRRAVRDHVYDMLRRQRSYAALGGAQTGRCMAIGALLSAGIPAEALMTGEGHAPSPPTPSEIGRSAADLTAAEAADMPDWLYDRLVQDWGAEAPAIASALHDRAPLFVRVNLARIDQRGALQALRTEDITAELVEGVKTALRITENTHKIALSQAYQRGLIELQDASSQAAVLALPLATGDHVLDYCAGGGGKSLAIAGLCAAQISAHDAYPKRMRDLPVRAARAGCDITLKSKAHLVPHGYDLVLVDAPCSGSGTWRRDPEGKWRLTPQDLQDLTQTQRQVVTQALGFVRPGGHLAYATCSVLDCENHGIVRALRADIPGLSVETKMQRMPNADGDGFFLCVMKVPSPTT